MVGDMILMDELRGKFGVQYFWLIMTLDALSFGDMAIALNDTEMAPFTGHTSCNILLMIKTPTINFNISLGCKMAGSATPYGARKAFSLPPWTSLEIVTDETIDLVNGEMGSLDELGMTGSASKFHPPSQLT
jgi:hypothetical protein